MVAPLWEKADPYIRLSPICINRESAAALRKLCKRERFSIYEDGMFFLIKAWEKYGETRDFSWGFNHCARPKYWFGDRIIFGRRSGIIYGMEWIDSEMSTDEKMKRGWWYRCKFVAPSTIHVVHESELTPL